MELSKAASELADMATAIDKGVAIAKGLPIPQRMATWKSSCSR